MSTVEEVIDNLIKAEEVINKLRISLIEIDDESLTLKGRIIIRKTHRISFALNKPLKSFEEEIDWIKSNL